MKDTNEKQGETGTLASIFSICSVQKWGIGVKKFQSWLITSIYFIKLGFIGLVLCMSPVTALAQVDHTMTVVPEPEQFQAIDLGTTTLPRAENKESWYTQYGSRFARNVTQATLTPFLPDSALSTRAAVIVAPGGGFRTLSMDNEGWNVAEALAKKGIAAFVLKYRLQQTPREMESFQSSMQQMFSDASRRSSGPQYRNLNAQLKIQLEDAFAAISLIRERAEEWNIDPDRIGMMGFSAGAMLTMSTTLADSKTDLAFIANIYGPLGAITVPENAPPLFVAIAADDPLFSRGEFDLVQAWFQAGRPVEFHFYEQGGHGFGMYPKSTTSTGWFNAFVHWLAMHEFLRVKN